MSATESRSDRREQRPEAPRRRPLASRLSTAHVLMIAAGVLAALLNFVLLRSADERIDVAVAAADLRPGDPVDAASFQTVSIPADTAFVDALVRAAHVDRYAGHVAVTHVAAGDPVPRSALRDGPGDGLRSMSIPVEPAHAAGGRLAAGDRVDIIRVVDGRSGFVATDVAVLGVGDGSTDGALGNLGNFSITVAVDADTALRLAEAIAGGNLEVVRSTGAEPARVSRASRTEPPPTSTAAASREDP